MSQGAPSAEQLHQPVPSKRWGIAGRPLSPKEPCTGTTVSRRDKGCFWHYLPRHTDRAPWTDVQRAAGGKDAGEALPVRRVKHLWGQTSATCPLYLFVTCLPLACNCFLLRFHLVLCCTQDNAGCAPSRVQEAESALQCSSTCPTPILLPGWPIAGAHGASRTGTGMAELRWKSRARAKGCLESARPPLRQDSLLPPFHRTRNRNCSRTSLGHFSFPICFSTFLSLSRSSCSPSPAVSTGTG